MAGRPRLTVVGLGPAGPELTPPAATAALEDAGRVLLRTTRHPAASALVGAESFDRVYDEEPTFEAVYRRIVAELVEAATMAATMGTSLVYAVPGSPLVAEATVALLRADGRVALSVVPALSFVDLAWDRLGIDPLAEGVRLVDGTRFATAAAGEVGPLLVAQTWSPAVLSEIKLSVDDPAGGHPAVTVLHHLGLPDEQVLTLPWDELDRALPADHLTSLYVPELAAPVAAELVALDELVRTLRERCPWDREQTHASLRRHLLEETYELLDAIDELVGLGDGASGPEEAGAVAHLEEELGDVLFQVYFHARLAAEEGRFTMADVARTVHDKLVSRHPHVFGDVVAETPDAVAANWEVLKQREKGRSSVTDGVPHALPALSLAAKLQGRAAGAGISAVEAGDDPGWVLSTLERGPAGDADGDAAFEMVGRLLFDVVELARRRGVDPELALRHTSLAFAERVRQREDGSSA